MDLEVTPIIVAFLTGGVAHELIRWIRLNKELKNGFSYSIDVMSKVRGYLNNLMERTAGKRVSFIVATPAPDDKKDELTSSPGWFISIIDDSSNPPLVTVKDKFKSFEVDFEYCEMLSELKSKRDLRIFTEDLNGILRDVYEPVSITYSDIRLIDHGSNWIAFISINYVHDEDNSMDQRNELNILVNQLRRLPIGNALKNMEINGVKID